MTPVTLFSYITPEEQERMRICFDMHEAVYRNNETVMEYSSSMKKIGLILEGQAVLYCIDEDGNQYMIDNLKKDSVLANHSFYLKNPSTIMSVQNPKQECCLSPMSM